jgi:hypothetical protein
MQKMCDPYTKIFPVPCCSLTITLTSAAVVAAAVDVTKFMLVGENYVKLQVLQIS